MLSSLPRALAACGPDTKSWCGPPSTPVKLLPQLLLHGSKAGALPHLSGLERVAAQRVDQQQMKVQAAGVVVVALSVRRPVDVALVVTVASLMRRVVALLVEALLTTKLRHQSRACRSVV